MPRISKEELNERRKRLLCLAVKDYILTGENIASKKITEKYSLEVSSATVRNDLAWLEEKGFLFQPHLSAGRVPTDEGYRFYVRSLGEETVLQKKDREAIKKFLSVLTNEVEEIYKQVANLLTDLTCCFGLTVSTIVQSALIKHLDLVKIGSRSLLIALILDNGNIIRTTVEIGESIQDERVKQIENKLKSEISGNKLSDVLNLEKESLKGLSSELHETTEKITTGLKNVISEDARRSVFFGETPDFSLHPEMMEPERMLKIFKLFDKNNVFFGLAQEALGNQSMIVKIGKDNPPAVRDFSFIAAPYELRKTVGIVGVLGPKRMNYAKAIAVVNDVSQHLSWRLYEIYGS